MIVAFQQGFYRPQTKLRKGNVFTSVCQEFCPRRGVSTPPRQTPPTWADTTTPKQTRPPSRRLLQRTVHIILECILVISVKSPEKMFLSEHCRKIWKEFLYWKTWNALISPVTVKNSVKNRVLFGNCRGIIIWFKELINSAVMCNHMCQHVWQFR